MSTVRISSEHCRAICDEVGERLRLYLDGRSAAPSQRIMALLRELELSELEAPSIVPSLEDMTILVSESPVR
ncbi:hypothetical protein UP10_34550 [Bradyrhizobium sp. LTSPM299]|nr:hypothetical protein UP10_34550 [Bradyrhizobium sp. LTSPM299]